MTATMPDPILTDERRAFVEAIRDLGEREAGTREQRAALTQDFAHNHNQGLYRRLGELDWIGCCLPEDYGGSGGGVVDACLLLEHCSHGRLPIFGMTTSLIVGSAVEKFGTEDQKREILAGICRGDIASIAMSEPGSGSDVASLSCRARRENGHYVIDGQKTWISNAQEATRILLVCRTGAASTGRHDGITMLDLPADAPGVEIRPISTMGGSEVNDVYLDGVRVDAGRLIGVEGGAWGQLMAGLNFERLTLAAYILGHARRAFDDALAFVAQREQFGQPVGSFQVIKHRVADLATELECCRLLVYDVARRADAQPASKLPREASMAKLKVTETAKQIAIEGMQMMGGYGYSTEYEMERHLRTAIASTVYGGTSEIQREIIGRNYEL